MTSHFEQQGSRAHLGHENITTVKKLTQIPSSSYKGLKSCLKKRASELLFCFSYLKKLSGLPELLNLFSQYIILFNFIHKENGLITFVQCASYPFSYNTLLARMNQRPSISSSIPQFVCLQSQKGQTTGSRSFNQ